MKILKLNLIYFSGGLTLLKQTRSEMWKCCWLVCVDTLKIIRKQMGCNVQCCIKTASSFSHFRRGTFDVRRSVNMWGTSNSAWLGLAWFFHFKWRLPKEWINERQEKWNKIKKGKIVWNGKTWKQVHVKWKHTKIDEIYFFPPFRFWTKNKIKKNTEKNIIAAFLGSLN